MIFPTKPTGTPVLSLREFVRGTLLDRIARGILLPGQRIIETKLIQEFGISSTPVREALFELVSLGVLTSEANKGASVREVFLHETIEAFQVRAALEALAAQTAAHRLSGNCGPLRKLADAIIRSAAKRDFAAFQGHNQVFHRTIVEAAGNAVLLKTWDGLFFQIRTRWTMDYLRSFDPVAIAREHVPIVDALDSNLPELAASLLDSHSSHLVTFLAQETTDSSMAACGQSRSGLGLAAAKPVAKTPATRER